EKKQEYKCLKRRIIRVRHVSDLETDISADKQAGFSWSYSRQGVSNLKILLIEWSVQQRLGKQ
ncbi:hypothetical protein OS493_040175, partial [Desmophyllum pertusum]